MDISLQLDAAKKSASAIRSLNSIQKRQVIESISECIELGIDDILAVNQKEVSLARSVDFDESQIDRLTLTKDRIKSMAEATFNVAQLTDPIGEVIENWKQESGISIKKVRVPIGVVAVIYENRPNVTLDAAGICLMSGNVCVLRGSSAARNTNKVIVDLIHKALSKHSIPNESVTFIDDPSRQGAISLMKAKEYIDVLIPRGGPSLINAVQEHATVPTIIDGAGNCHVYVDKDADLDMAESLIINSKTQRNSVCNAAESLVVHSSVANEFIPRIAKSLGKKNVEIVGDGRSVELGDGFVMLAEEEDFSKEFLSNKISVCIVENIDDAIDWINSHSSGHTEMIVSDNPESVDKFMALVSSAVVMHNTSTRFTDGERFGFGAEIGISTQKLHARGPMALKELTTYQYNIFSDGCEV